VIESISAVTLATHDMRRAVRFYRMLGFELLYGSEDATFSSFRAGDNFLNLIVQSPKRRWSWWGRLIFSYRTSTRSIPGSSPPAACPTRRRAMPNGASASST